MAPAFKVVEDVSGLLQAILELLLLVDTVLDGVLQLGAKTQVAVVEQMLTGLLRRTDLWGKQTEEVLNDGCLLYTSPSPRD